MEPNLLILIVVCAVVYYLMLRPQQKRERQHRELVRSLADGDEVITNAGIHGVIVEVEADVVWLEVAPGVELKIARDVVARHARRASDDESSEESETAVADENG